MVGLYRRPTDEAAFLEHDHAAHLPLMRRVPGLERLEVTRLTRAPLGGEPAFFLMAEMYFADLEAYRAAMRSPENAEAGRDLMQFAGERVTLVQGEVE
nr:EthD family reductase [Deinobacterium chartae]